jgi:hypothetical protein
VITGGVLQTATSGKRAIVNEGSTNSYRLYDDAGAGLQLLVDIGPTSYSGTAVARFGSNSAGNSAIGISGQSYGNVGVEGFSTTGGGVAGRSTGGPYGVYARHQGAGPGLLAESSSGPAIRSDGGVTAALGASHDPYGTVSVTRPTAASYSYYGLTRSGQMGMGMGLDTSNRYFIGTTTAGHNGTLIGYWSYLSPAGLQVAGGLGVNGVAPQARYALPGAGSDPLVNAIRQALINCGICQ